MRSAPTIETGNVIGIVLPSAIFPLDGSITTPPASGFAFDVSSSCSSSASDRAKAAGRLNARPHAMRTKTAIENRRSISVIALVLGSGADQHQLRLSSRGDVRIARVRLTRSVTQQFQLIAFATRRLPRSLRVAVRARRE